MKQVLVLLGIRGKLWEVRLELRKCLSGASLIAVALLYRTVTWIARSGIAEIRSFNVGNYA